MKVQLVVVRGKPEGKVIPLVGTKFKIGRGETCHLRPNSEQVSREHAEFTLESNAVTVRDLGSRNGTLVNGKALTTESYKLKDRDLVQVGPLTFAVSIQDATPPPTKPAAPSAAAARRHPGPDQTQALTGRHLHRRHRFLAPGRQCEPVGRPANRRLWGRHDHDHRVQGRAGAVQGREQAALGCR